MWYHFTFNYFYQIHLRKNFTQVKPTILTIYHVTHLWISRQKLIQKVHPWGFVYYFIVSYVTITLSGQKHYVRIRIVERKDNTRWTVYGVSCQRLTQIILVPNWILSIRMSWKTRSKQTPCRAQECHFTCFWSCMTNALLEKYIMYKFQKKNLFWCNYLLILLIHYEAQSLEAFCLCT